MIWEFEKPKMNKEKKINFIFIGTICLRCRTNNKYKLFSHEKTSSISAGNLKHCKNLI